MTNHVRIEVDGEQVIEADVEVVTLSRDYSTGAFTFQGGPQPTARPAAARSGLIEGGLQAVAANLRANSKAAGERAHAAAQAAEVAKAPE